MFRRHTIVFVDEIHRFKKNQQVREAIWITLGGSLFAWLTFSGLFAS